MPVGVARYVARNPYAITGAVLHRVFAAPAVQPLSFSRTEIPAGPSCCSIVTGDLNGDGKPDLVVTFSDSADAGGRQLLVLMGNGDGSFALPKTLDLGQSFLLVAAVDVNGDNKADLIITTPFKGDSFVLLSLSFFARRNDFVMPPSKVDLVDGGWSWLWLEQPRR